MRILYIEDNSVDADLFQRELARQPEPVSVNIASTLEEARHKLGDGESYDLVLIDLKLPDGSGLDLLAEIRKEEIPVAVVILTGQGDEESAVTALKAGADDYLIKGNEKDKKILEILKNAFKRYEAESSLTRSRIHVLYIEHSNSDIDLTRRHLTRHAPNIELTIFNDTRKAYEILKNINNNPDEYDLVLLDYRMPGLNALELLKLMQLENDINIPVVLVTGHGDEEIAIQALRLGAADYLVKNPGYLYQLPAALENAYHRNQLILEREALKKSEERFRRLAENAQDLIYRVNFSPAQRFEYVSPAAFKITGYTPEEHYANSNLGFELVHDQDKSLLQDISSGKSSFEEPLILRWIRKDGRLIWIEQRNVPVYDDKGNLVAIEGIARDITERINMEEELQNTYKDLARAYDATIEGWSRALDLKDHETEGHSNRVTEQTVKLARACNIPEEDLEHVRRGALLHDIGKMGIPDYILNKKGKLDDQEWYKMKEHPRLAYDLLKPIPFLKEALNIPFCHHEKWDGSGYPRGLKGDEIPLAARVFSVIDVFDALTSNRPYRPAWSKAGALKHIEEEKGNQFDPFVVDKFFELFYPAGY